MSLRVRAFVAAAVAGSLAFGIPAAASADAGASTALTGSALARFPDFAALPDSKLLGLPVMLQGTLSDLGGKPLSRAQVLVSAWPSNDTIAALPQRGEFDVVPIARTTAGRNGGYELRSVLTPLLATLMGQDGLDIELDVFHGERHYVYLSQVRMDRAVWVRDVVEGVDGQATPAAKSTAANLLDLALDPAEGERLNTSAPSSSWPPPRAEGEAPYTKRDKPFPGVMCTRYKKVNENPVRSMTTVATAVVSNGATVKPLYTKGATTVTSTGFSFDGGVSFAINGARERTAKIDADFRDWSAKRGKTVAREFRMEVNHEVLRRVCLGNDYDDYRVQYVTTPTGLTGGGDDVKSRYDAFSCKEKNVAKAVFDEVATENQKAATYTRAFGIKPLGEAKFSGNALSGYSESVRIAYTFGKAKRGAWCGHSGTPSESGQRLHGFAK